MSDGIPWTGPACSECGAELTPEPLATTSGVSVAYTCPTHGVTMMHADPFGDPNDPEIGA